MDPETLKVVVDELAAVVDGVIKATPNVWDDMIWGVCRKTILSDKVLNHLVDRLTAKGMMKPA